MTPGAMRRSALLRFGLDGPVDAPVVNAERPRADLRLFVEAFELGTRQLQQIRRALGLLGLRRRHAATA
jgi:hypothetical protein